MSELNCTFIDNVLSDNEIQSQTSFASAKSSILSSCRICLSSILDPAILTCGHRFCEKCLFQYWDDKDKPEFIVCPLCRGNANRVHFAKKEDISATADFRRTFNSLSKLRNISKVNTMPNFFLQLSVMIPIFYCVFQWIHIPLNFIRRSWNFLVLMQNK